MHNVDSIGGELLGAARGKVHVFPRGRTCAAPGCDTVLSIYNGHDCCAEHDFDAGLVHFRAPQLAETAEHGPAAPHVAHRRHRPHAA